MAANGHCLGGEQSGHIIFSKFASTGDGILTSLKLMEVMLESKQKLSELTQEVEIYPQLLQNIRVKSKPETLNDEEVCKAVDEVAKILGNDGRILVRQSGTEPVIRVMVEAKTQELCKQYVDQVIKVIRDRGHEVA
jgi:phosphoglucosamine mutase